MTPFLAPVCDTGVAIDGVAAHHRRKYLINLETAKKIARHAFPDYHGRKINLVVDQQSIDVLDSSNWSGGTRIEYIFVRLDNGDIMKNPFQYDAPWRRDSKKGAAVLQDGLVCVAHSIFQGRDMGVTVYTDQP